MLRLAFTVYLALLALAGPGLCCCTALGKPGQSRACCQQRNDAPAPSSPDGPAPHCPCDDYRSIAAVLGHSEGQLDDSVRPGHIAAFAVTLDWRPSGPTNFGAQSLTVSPGDDGTLFGRDMLRAFCAHALLGRHLRSLADISYLARSPLARCVGQATALAVDSIPTNGEFDVAI